MTKTNVGHFFDDYSVGQVFHHGPARNVGEGERALYQALYSTRFAIAVSDPVAQACGLPHAPLDDLIVLHKVSLMLIRTWVILLYQLLYVYKVLTQTLLRN